MGYEITRFKGEICSDLVCPICSDVMENPAIAPNCEHAFCRACITRWLLTKTICPMDNAKLEIQNLLPPPRILRNFLGALFIKCDFASQGCMDLVKLEDLNTHTKSCEHNPMVLVSCNQNCGTILLRGELPVHSCVQSLKMEITQLRQISERKYIALSMELEELKHILQQLPLHQPLKFQFKWWQKLEKEQWAVIGMVPSFGYVPDDYAFYLKQSGCTDKELSYFVVCKCRRGYNHTCSLERFKGYPANFRTFYNSKICLALSCENKHLSQENTLPEPGVIFIT